LSIVAIARDEVPVQVWHLVAEAREVDVVTAQRAHEGALSDPQVLRELLPLRRGELIDAVGVAPVVDRPTRAAITLIARQVQRAARQLPHAIEVRVELGARAAQRAVEAAAQALPYHHAGAHGAIVGAQCATMHAAARHRGQTASDSPLAGAAVVAARSGAGGPAGGVRGDARAGAVRSRQCLLDA